MSFKYISFICLIFVEFLIYLRFYKAVYKYLPKKIEKTVTGVILTLIFFFSIFFSSQILNESEIKQAGNQTVFWITLFITLYAWAYSHNYKNKDVSANLKSTRKNNSSFEQPILKDISKIKNNEITTYPRFTVGQNILALNSKIIFDSSDFEVINRAFKTVDEYQQSLVPGKQLYIYDDVYLINDVRVDFLSVFDDYSFSGRRDVNAGLNTPYNIQILIEVTIDNEM